MKCASCSEGTLKDDTLTKTALKPTTFPAIIAIGLTGSTASFTAPLNTATICSPSTACSYTYDLQCRVNGSSDTYSKTLFFVETFSSIATATPSLTVVGLNPENLQGKVW